MVSQSHLLNPPSDRREFADFPAFYQSDIAPYLRAREEQRRSALMASALLGGGLGLAAVIILIVQPFGAMSTHAGFFAGFGAMVGAGAMLAGARRKIGDGLMEMICKKLGFGYAGTRPRPHYLRLFTDLKFFSRFNRETFEDEVAGVYRGTNFLLCEAHLKYKSSGKNSSTRTVFHGQLFVIDYPKEFLGVTVVRRDAGMLNRLGKPGREFHQIGLASGEFEKAFEAWGTDQVEARELLDPIVLERFQELERLFKNSRLRAAFVEGKLIIALETGDRLNMGSMLEPLESPDRVETILAEFDVIFDLIDVAVTRIDVATAGAVSVENVRDASQR